MKKKDEPKKTKTEETTKKPGKTTVKPAKAEVVKPVKVVKQISESDDGEVAV